MAFSIQRAVSDGTMTLLPISIEYFDREEISVLFNGVLNARQWAWVGTTEKTLSFTPAVANGIEVSVIRTTDMSVLRHQFSLGAQFTAQSLDESLIQVLHIAQEASEQLQGTDFYNDINIHGFKITNVADGVADGDAVTMRQQNAHNALIISYRDAAAASAAAALASQIAAALSEANAAASAIIQVNSGATNAVIRTLTTGSAILPVGTTAQRDASPVVGMFRYNSTLNSFEGYKNGSWGPVGGGATGGVGDDVFYENGQTVTQDYTITAGKNAMSAGPITIANGKTVTVPSGSFWTIV